MADTTAKTIITCAVTGASLSPSMSPYLPCAPEDIVAQALEAEKAGASIFHLHARNRDGSPLDKDKLKVDSDKAIEIATAEPLLKNLKILATRLTLERWEEMPVWKVRLWAAKLRNPAKDVDIGEVFITADTGKVIKNDLRISRVD
jgi:uncharacterized protein (DUF849 family)